MKQFRSRNLAAFVWFLVVAANAPAQSKGSLAPGAPGKDAKWANAGKEGIGTSNTRQSKVWFTLQGGVLTEVFYPTVDMPNVQVLQFVVVNPARPTVETELEDANSQVKVLSDKALSFRQINRARNGQWTISKTYTTDPQRNTLLIDVKFETQNPALDLYVYFDPSLNNSGMHDSAWTHGPALIASDADKFSALLSSGGFTTPTNGFSGTSDGMDQLKQSGRIRTAYARAENGNVVQLARINHPKHFTLVLGFGQSAEQALSQARDSLRKGFIACRREYEVGWQSAGRGLPEVSKKYRRQFRLAVMVLKAHEDKTIRGASVASLSSPWIGGAAANEPHVSGYHLVWARDLYQIATAYLVLGDRAGARRALDYLFQRQQKADGSFPQITWVDGRPVGDAIQMDEVAYPLILAYQIGRTDPDSYAHVKLSADYIVRTGPVTQQERWEEKSGYSPATIAAEIAGLVCAAEIGSRNGDEASAQKYLAVADDWQRKIESWTATTNGKYGDGNYYLRLTQKGTPDAGNLIELNNNGGTLDEREMVDPSFLELVRLGIRSARDPLIEKSVKVIDQLIRVKTQHGDAWFRYVRDGYGEMEDGRPWNWDGKYTGKGHLWVLLTGERGEYEIARGEFAQARERLDTMLGFANEGMMPPEQVWDRPQSPRPELKFGEGTGSATPLAWSAAQFIRLAVNLKAGKNLDTPAIVAARYRR